MGVVYLKLVVHYILVSDDTSDGPGRSAPPTAVSATLVRRLNDSSS